MNSFLTSLKADLLDRRLRAVLLALGLGLVAALVYALTGGSSSTPAPATASVAPSRGSGIAAVAAPATANQPVAETTSGVRVQREGKSRDPFTPLPGTTASAASAAAATKSSGSSGGSSKAAGKSTSQTSSESSKSSSGGSSPKSGKSTPAPPKPKVVYRVAILFGIVPEGTPAKDAQLTPYTNVKTGKKLPSTQAPLLSFRGVSSGGKHALFEVVGEAFLKGSAVCMPSAAQCQTIALAQGKSEEVEYIPAGGGPPVMYELQVVSITSNKAAAARARISLLRRLHVLKLAASPLPVSVSG